ncbi:MAG TPA: competence/damage-inducible protein A [Polyangiaceae bacterium]|jgi:nicotinamide-nucleotide amidase|nr:competence/damage-inducible protein A [Polyangiaceae bacterium]
MSTAAILCIGTELTRGELQNSNATWLAEALTTIGFDVLAVDCVDDERGRIERALDRLSRVHDVLVCTGGLGPTTDDITTECAARLAGVELERDAQSLEYIRERLSRFGREMAPSNAKQADFPRGSRILPNPNGTAPGFELKLGGALAYFMPGVPFEMKAMFDSHVAPSITPLLRDRHFQLLLRTFGLPESAVNDRLAGIESEFDVTIGYRATMPEIEVKVLARAESLETARERSVRAAQIVRARLGDEIVFGEGTTRFPEAVSRLLETRGLTLGLAESCTGGLVAELVTAHPGASAVFRGGAVTYANETKTSLLGVPESLLAAHGAVSSEAARSMAEGALRTFDVDIALALTGIAGPGGGTPEKPVGLVHYAVATRAGVSDVRVVFSGNREQIRRRAAFAGLSLVRSVVLRGHDPKT